MTVELLKSRTGRTLIESHRSVEGDLPENSWPAVRMGHQLGADLIEVDVQLSRDGVPFLHHNYQLPDGRWCKDLSWMELKELTIRDEPLPRLEEVLDWARQEHVLLSLDLKTFFLPQGCLTREVIRLLERTNTKDQMVLLFWDHEELRLTKLSHPDLTVRALLTGRLLDIGGYLRSIQADCVSVSYGMLRPGDIEQIHAAGAAMALVELWDPASDLLQQFNIDILSCGSPVQARQFLDHR